MSFSSNIKEELVHLKINSSSQRLVQLAGITHTAGSLYLGKSLGVRYLTESSAVAKHIAYLAADLYSIDAEIVSHEQDYRSIAAIEVTLTGPNCIQLLEDVGAVQRTNEGLEFPNSIPSAFLKTDSTAKFFLRGTFLGSGSCSNPKRTYHLELSCRQSYLADTLCHVLNQHACNAKSMTRKGKHVVYLKEGNAIATFLTIIGSTKGMLDFESMRAEKEMRNYINRTSNCATANIGKTINAASDQLRAIEILQNHYGLQKLPPPLREAALLRLEHPDATLQEIADIAGVGKSGIYHRFERIRRMANEITG